MTSPDVTGQHRGHAADAEAILDHLGVRRAHIAGHSGGAAVAAELALHHPETVHTLILLELSLLSVPSGEAFFQQAGAAFSTARRRRSPISSSSGKGEPRCRRRSPPRRVVEAACDHGGGTPVREVCRVEKVIRPYLEEITS